MPAVRGARAHEGIRWMRVFLFAGRLFFGGLREVEVNAVIR